MFTLQQKIAFLSLLVTRCDRLNQEHGDKEGCNPNCNAILKEIEQDLRDIDVLRTFDHGVVS